MLYLYAFSDTPTAPLPSKLGLGGGQLGQYQHHGLAAVFSPLKQSLGQPTPTDIWHHEGILEALMQERTVLPFRFGTVLGRVEAVQNLLEKHHTAIKRNISTLQGRVEVAVRGLGRINASAETPSEHSSASLDQPPQSGTAYLQQRLREEKTLSGEEQQARRHFEQINARLSPLSVAQTHSLLPQKQTLFKAAYLLEAAKLTHFQNTLAEVNRAEADLRLVCTGPWPAYSFVDLPRLSL